MFDLNDFLHEAEMTLEAEGFDSGDPQYGEMLYAEAYALFSNYTDSVAV